MLGQASNQLLADIESKTQAKIPENLRAVFAKTIKAGLTLMYSPKGTALMKSQFAKEGEVAFNIGEGIAKLIGLMYQQSKKTMPPQIAVPAATMLMCEALDFLAKAGKIQLDAKLIAATTKELGSSVLQLFGVTPQKLQQMMAERKAGGQPGAPQASAAALPAVAPRPGLINTPTQGV